MSRRPSNWYDMTYDEQRQCAERDARRARDEAGRQLAAERESSQEECHRLSEEYDEVCQEAEALKAGLGMSLDWLEHSAVHDAFRNDRELYAKLTTHIEATRVALGRVHGEVIQ